MNLRPGCTILSKPVMSLCNSHKDAKFSECSNVSINGLIKSFSVSLAVRQSALSG